MNVKSYKADIRSPVAVRENSFLAVMRVAQSLPTVTKTSAQIPVTNTMRATTITVVLDEILTHPGYPHGGINE